MKKRVVTLLLTAALALPLALPAGAEVADVPQAEKAAVLRELEIMVGDQSGDLALDRPVSRAEFTKLLVAASPYRDAVPEAAGTDPYPDVSHTSWYAPYVRAAVDAGLVKGDLAGWFHPEAQITLAEGATMAVRLLGWSDDLLTAPWPAGQLAVYRSADLDQGVSAQSGDDLLTRQDCLHIFYDLLCANTASGAPYAATLGCALNSDGEVDVNSVFHADLEGPIPLTGNWSAQLPFSLSQALVFRDGERAQLSELRDWDLLYWLEDQPILFATSDGQSAMGQLTASVEGPVVAQGDWQSQLPFPLTQVTSVTRNGAAAGLGDIAAQDVVYWSKYAKALYVYARTVSGTVEAVSPSLAAPAAVTVAGVTYSLETFEAQYAFSDLGDFRVGDQVRLLLGRTGGVAAVRALDAQEVISRVGVVSSLESRTYTDRNGDPYAAKVVVLTAADGLSYAYPYPWRDVDDFDPGVVVEVRSQNGQTTVQRLGRNAVSGTVNAAATRLGALALSPDVEILDTYGEHTAKAVPPSRLAGVELTGDMVRWYATDSAGAISTLILNDVTGDCHSYGVVTDAESVSVPATGLGTMTTQSVYTLDLAGRQQVLPVSGKRFPVVEGPVCLAMDGQEVRELHNLTRLAGVTLDGRYALSGDSRWPLADNVLYYTYNTRSRTYTLASREQVTAGDATLSAWYDTRPTAGGRVRVILAEEK